MKFTIVIDCGDLFIDGEFVSQLNFNAQSIGYSVARYLYEHGYPSCDPISYSS